MTHTAPVAVLAGVLLAGFGWALPWPEPARAGYILQWVGFGALCWALSHDNRRTVRLAALLGMGVATAGAGCGAWYNLLSSPAIGVCDATTGRPITAAAFAAALAVVAAYIREYSRGNSSCR